MIISKKYSVRIIICIVLAMTFSVVNITDLPHVFAEEEKASAAVPADAVIPEPGELIVVYESSKTENAEDAAAYTGELIDNSCLDSTEPVADSVGDDGAAVLVKLDDDKDTDRVRSMLEKHEGVSYVQPNFRYSMMGIIETDDVYYDDLYHLNAWDETFQSQCGASVKEAWELMGGINPSDDFVQAEVTIAVLDTGCQVTHEDLNDAVDMEHAYDAVRQLKGAEYIADQSGHGTHVCGIAAGIVNNGKGIAGAAGNHARILPINVFKGQWSWTSDMLTGFSYLEKLMDSGELENLHVINMSLGGYGETDEEDAALGEYITRMREKDVLTVCAGGNGDEETGFAYKDNPCFPGDYEDCLCVTSLDSDGTNSIFSDYNMYKDISAPGSFIFSTMTDEKGTAGDSKDGKYGFLSGTSMASPLVAGIAGLLWADNPQLTADQVFESITRTANEVNNAVFSHEGETGSAGAIDSAEAMLYARTHFDTERTRITADDISLSESEFEFDGSEKKPDVTVKVNGTLLEEGKDYLVSYRDTVEAGTGSVTVTGISEYIGSVSREYKIDPANLSGAEVIVEPNSFEYDGLYHFPKTLEVSYKGTILKWGKDYSVTALTNGISAGRHSIEIIGKGNYSGSYTAEYLIKGEDDGTDQDAQAQKIAEAGKYKVSGLKVKVKGRRFTVSWKKTGGATGYQVQYRLKTAKKWTQLKKTKALKAVSKKLKKNRKYQFKVRTYTQIAGGTYYGKWTKVKTVKCK